MKVRPCPHESEVRELLQQGHWPAACEPDLRAHIDTCEACAQTVQFAEMFQAARAASMQRAPIAAAGPIWWRAQLRRRNAAFERIAKPIRTAQIFAAAICLVATIAILIFEQRSGNASIFSNVLHPTQLLSGWSPTFLVSTVAILAVSAAVALFLATDTNEPNSR